MKRCLERGGRGCVDASAQALEDGGTKLPFDPAYPGEIRTPILVADAGSQPSQRQQVGKIGCHRRAFGDQCIVVEEGGHFLVGVRIGGVGSVTASIHVADRDVPQLEGRTQLLEQPDDPARP